MQLCAQEGSTECLGEIIKSPAHLQSNWAESDLALQQSLVSAVRNSHDNCARILLEASADVNFRSEDYNASLLSWAIRSDNTASVKLLLEYRPDLDRTDKDEDTALHWVSGLTPVASIETILEAGAKIDMLNRRRESPLTAAVDVKNWNVVRYLLSKPATLPSLNISGYNGTPLHQACFFGPLDIVKLLVEKGADHSQFTEAHGIPLSKACFRLGDNYASEKEDVIRYLRDESSLPLKSRPMEAASDGMETNHLPP